MRREVEADAVDGCRAAVEKARRGELLARGEIAALLASETAQAALFAAADEVRARCVGDEVHLRALIEFSNHCRCDCFYCGLRRSNGAAQRYRLAEDEVFALAEKARGYGYRTVVLQSGEDGHFTAARLTRLLRRIKALDLAITLSCGEKSSEEYAAFKEAGADRYLLRIETTDRALYASLHPGMDFDNRLRCLADLRRLGYEVGTGCLIGLPGQSLLSLADDLLFFRRIDADMVGCGPFIPNADTPLVGAAGGALDVSLRFVALARLLLPEANIPATTALETLSSGARTLALKAGANVFMPNVTEGESREKYALYPGKVAVCDTPEDCSRWARETVERIGRRVSDGYGYRKRRGEEFFTT